MIWSKYVLILLLFLMTLASTSCQKKNGNSVLILAFDDLPKESFNCLNEKLYENSGLQILCNESIQYTKSYTTSLQSAAAMGSLLSGKYPIQHQLRHSQQKISSSVTLLSEIAHKNHFKSSFFSGSPHILRKTGLSKYFDFFNDDVIPQIKKNYIKDFKNQTEDFWNWFDDESPQQFFTVIYNSELTPLNLSDLNKSSIEILDEKLFFFFEEMKARNLWNTTTLLLVGLNGQNNYSRYNETSLSSLHNENTQVLTFFKPLRGQVDDGVNWKSDKELNLIYLNQLLQCVLTNCKQPPALKGTQNLLIESFETQIQNKANRSVKFAVVQGNENYIHSQPPQLYNTLLDPFETHNLFDSKNEKHLRYFQIIANFGIESPLWEDHKLLYRYQSNLEFHLNKIQRKELLYRISDPKNPLIVYKIEQALKDQNTYEIEILRKKRNTQDLENNGCLLFNKFDPILLKDCKRPLYVAYFKYKHAKELNLDPKKTEAEYLNTKSEYMRKIHLYTLNLAFENIWGLEIYQEPYFIEELFFQDSNFF